MSYIEGDNLSSVIRVNEVVMEVQIIVTSIIYFILPSIAKVLGNILILLITMPPISS